MSLTFLTATSVASNGGPPETKFVVVLYPEASNGSPGNAQADRGIRATFGESGIRAEIHDEYLDVTRFPDADYQRELAGYLSRKYANRRIDVVIVGLASALDFALSHRDVLFHDVPLLFFSVDESEVKARKIGSDVIGIPITMDLKDSLDLALRLQPRTEQVFVVVGRSKFDAYWESAARKLFGETLNTRKITYLAGLPMPDLLRRVSELPEHSVIYYLHVFEDGAGQVHIPADVLSQISEVAKVPIFSHVDSYLGRGIVGGRLFSFEEEGKRIAKLALRVLNGESPQSIGVREASRNPFVFDARQLRQWGIEEASLPPDSVVRFREPTTWELYKWQIVGLLVLFAFQALLIVGLIIQSTRRSRADRRFRLAIDASPTGMLMIGHDGLIALANAKTEILFGYPNGELVGRPVETLIADSCRARSMECLQRFFERPIGLPAGIACELVGHRKNGSDFPLEIGLNPINTEAGIFGLASVVDLTSSRQAESELVGNQRELQQLTGKLLVAQELERRRIACELHDDFGQELALLSVELDVLGGRSSRTSHDAEPLIDALAARVKHLSSSIHDLSHRLHPMKLEQLGLAAAVGSLCKELTCARRSENRIHSP